MVEKISNEEQQEVPKKINSYYGSSFSTDFILFKKIEKNDEKIFVYSGSFIPKLPIEWIGLHFATICPDGIYLSIEGAQVIGKTATKNVLDIDREQVNELMNGRDLAYVRNLHGYIIIKNNKDIIGVCRVKENKIMNMIPKSRRLLRKERYLKPSSDS